CFLKAQNIGLMPGQPIEQDRQPPANGVYVVGRDLQRAILDSSAFIVADPADLRQDDAICRGAIARGPLRCGSERTPSGCGRAYPSRPIQPSILPYNQQNKPLNPFAWMPLPGLVYTDVSYGYENRRPSFTPEELKTCTSRSSTPKKH